MKWFKHDSDASQDNKLQNVLLDYGLEGYGLYWHCLELIAGKVDSDNVTFELEHDARVIARNVGCTPQKVEEMMRYFVNVGLFENADGVITCLKMAKRLDKSMTSNIEMRKTIGLLNLNNTQLDGYVYFIEKRDNSGCVIAIKIGRSKNPTARLSEISKIDENVGFDLQIIHKVQSENCVELETELHRKFKHLNIVNEWFKPEKEIYDSLRIDYVMTTSAYVMQDKIRTDKNREENTIVDSSESPRVDFLSELFEKFWKHYPTKQGKQKALAKFRLFLKGKSEGQARFWMNLMLAYYMDCRDKQVVGYAELHAATYIHNKRWEDNPEFMNEFKEEWLKENGQ